MKTKLILSIGCMLLLTCLAQAANKPDFSTPISAAKSYFMAATAVNTTILTNGCVGTSYQKDWLVMFHRSRIAAGRLNKALTAKYGAEGTSNELSEMLEFFPSVPEASLALANCDVKIDGTNATITFRPSGGKPSNELTILYGLLAIAPTQLDTMKLLLVGHEWKVVLDPVIDKAQINTDWLKNLVAKLDQCTKIIESGKFKTAQEANQAIDQIMNKEENATTSPGQTK